MTQSAVAAAPAEPTRRLAKDLRQRHVAMISIGGIIGAGLFVGSSAGIATIGPAVVVSYLLAGIVVLLVMRMLGEMAAAYPEVGAFSEYARLGLGNWAGFTAGWLYWYFWVVVVAIEALAGANVLHAWVAAPVWAIALVLVLLMMATNLWSARSYGE
ncbi:MAG TPA: amino acid permease, partial [Caulobacteraceae bacterium]